MKIGEGLVKKEEKTRLGLRARTSLWEDEAWDGFWGSFEENLIKLQQRILSGDLRVQPDPCDAYCDFKTICRYHEQAKPNT
jgi:hypothetical protein